MNTSRAIETIVNHLIYGPKEYVYHFISVRGKIKELRFDSKLKKEEIEGVLKSPFVFVEGQNNTLICKPENKRLKLKNKLIPTMFGDLIVAKKQAF